MILLLIGRKINKTGLCKLSDIFWSKWIIIIVNASSGSLQANEIENVHLIKEIRKESKKLMARLSKISY